MSTDPSTPLERGPLFRSIIHAIKNYTDNLEDFLVNSLAAVKLPPDLVETASHRAIQCGSNTPLTFHHSLLISLSIVSLRQRPNGIWKDLETQADSLIESGEMEDTDRAWDAFVNRGYVGDERRCSTMRDENEFLAVLASCEADENREDGENSEGEGLPLEESLWGRVGEVLRGVRRRSSLLDMWERAGANPHDERMVRVRAGDDDPRGSSHETEGPDEKGRDDDWSKLVECRFVSRRSRGQGRGIDGSVISVIKMDDDGYRNSLDIWLTSHLGGDGSIASSEGSSASGSARGDKTEVEEPTSTAGEEQGFGGFLLPYLQDLLRDDIPVDHSHAQALLEGRNFILQHMRIQSRERDSSVSWYSHAGEVVLRLKISTMARVPRHSQHEDDDHPHVTDSSTTDAPPSINRHAELYLGPRYVDVSHEQKKSAAADQNTRDFVWSRLGRKEVRTGLKRGLVHLSESEMIRRIGSTYEARVRDREEDDGDQGTAGGSGVDTFRWNRPDWKLRARLETIELSFLGGPHRANEESSAGTGKRMVLERDLESESAVSVFGPRVFGSPILHHSVNEVLLS
jgi:hypothetical protein